MSIQYATQVEVESAREASMRLVKATRQFVQGSQRQSRVPASKVAELDSLVTILKSALAAVIAASNGPTVLRSIAAETRVQDNVFVPGASRMHHCVRWPVTFGSGNSSTWRQMDNGWYANSGSAATDLATSFTIVSASLEYNGISVPVTWGGATTRTIAGGETEVQSDPLAAASFSVPYFTQGTVAYYEAYVTLPSSTANLPYSTLKNRAHGTGGQALYFDIANTSIVNGTGTVGPFTFSGTAPVEVTGIGYCPMFIGTFVSGDPKVFTVVGDSIAAGFGDIGTACPVGLGWIQRMAYGDGSNIYAMNNIARSGSSAFVYLGSGGKLAALAKYGNRGIYCYGTNDFGASGVARSRVQVLADNNANWTQMRAAGITKIIVPRLLVETTGTYATDGGQTINAGWVSGGPVNLYNTVDLPAELAASRIDAIIPMDFVRSATDAFKWGASLTADGTHPGTAGYTGLALEARPYANAA